MVERPSNLPAIDALRGMAILGVLAVHSSSWVTPQDPWLLAVAQAGKYGVQLFYVVSAFSLFRSATLRRREGRLSVLGYGIRRLLRIGPLFWSAILLYTAIWGFKPQYWAPDGTSWADVGLTAVFLHGWSPVTANSVVPGGWSIAVEVGFYVLLPLAFGIRSLRSALFVTIAVVIATHALCQWRFDELAATFPATQRYLPYTFAWTFWLPAQLPVFALGVVLFFLVEGRAVQPGLGVAWAAISIAMMIAATSASVQDLVSTQFLWGIAFMFLALAALSGEVPIFRSRLVTHVGRVSYGTYLWQFVVLSFCSRHLHRLVGHIGDIDLRFLVAWGLASMLSVILATITYQAIERPFMALGAHLASRFERVRTGCQHRGPTIASADLTS